MDQKRTQRIMGIVIVIALVIILFPLLFSKNETAPTVANIKTPPFPEPVANPDNNTVAENNAVEHTNPEQGIKNDATLSESSPMMPGNEQTQNETNSPQKMAPEANNEAVSNVIPAEPAESSALKAESSPLEEAHPTKSDFQKIKPVKKAILIQTPKSTSSHKDPVFYNKVAWVVQLGSFKDKNNAHKLANRLRAAGFSAFTREIQAKQGNQLRVYVGPEFKQFAAVKLSSKIEHELNLKGIVIPYRPLRL